jgi:hypothetical protein
MALLRNLGRGLWIGVKGMEEFVDIHFKVLQYQNISCFQLIALYQKQHLSPEYLLLEAFSCDHFVRLHCESLLQ